MLFSKIRDRRRRRRGVKDETDEMELVLLENSDVVGGGEGESEMLSSGRDSSDGDESGS